MRFCLFLISCALFGQTFPFPGPGGNASGGSTFTHVRSITLQASKAGSADNSNYVAFFTTNEDVLGAAISSTSATTLTLTYGNQIQVGDYLMIDSEIMGPVTGIVSLVATVTTRGAFSTTAATHLNGAVINDQFLANSAHGGSVTNANCYDCVFYSDSGLTTPLTWATVTYQTNGLATFRFVVGTYSHTINTTAYVAFGNSAITTFQGTGNVCTAAGYTSWWPFGTSSTLSVTDLCGNNNGTNHGVTASGPLVPTATGATIEATAGGSYYNPSGSNYVDIGTATDLVSSAISIEAWTIPINSSNPYIVLGQISGNSGFEYYVGAGGFTFAFGDGTNAAVDRVTSGCCAAAFPATFTGITLTGNTLLMYVNASSVAFSNLGSAASGLTAASVHGAIGSQTGASSSFPYEGNINELRVSSGVRGASYWTATYNNYGNPYSFYTMAIVR